MARIQRRLAKFLHTHLGTTIMRDCLSPYFRGIIHNPKLGDKASVFPHFLPSTWPFGGQTVPQSQNCANVKSMHLRAISCIYQEARNQCEYKTRRRRQSVPQNRQFPAIFSSTCTSTCAHSLLTTPHTNNSPIHKHTFHFPYPTERIICNMSTSDIGSGNSPPLISISACPANSCESFEFAVVGVGAVRCDAPEPEQQRDDRRPTPIDGSIFHTADRLSTTPPISINGISQPIILYQ